MTSARATDPRPPGDRAAQTRRRLLAAGCKVFSRKPIAAVSLKKDILDPAGVSVGSFYHQFRDKADLLLAIMGEYNERFRTAIHTARDLDEDEATTPEEVARRSYARVFDMVEENIDVVRIQLRGDAEAEPRIGAHFTEEARLWMSARADDYRRLRSAFGIEADPDMAAEMIGMLCEGAIRRYVALPREERLASRERMIHGLAHVTVNGVPGLQPPPAGPERPTPAEDPI